MKKNKGNVKLLKGEKLLYVILVLLIVAIPLFNVYSQGLLSESNIEVERYRTKIEKQTNINDSISMKINEMVSLDKIQNVANEIGLSYNNDNIKVISE